MKNRKRVPRGLFASPRQLPSGSWQVRWVDSGGVRQAKTFRDESSAKAFIAERSAEREAIKLSVDEGSIYELVDRLRREVADLRVEVLELRDAVRDVVSGASRDAWDDGDGAEDDEALVALAKEHAARMRAARKPVT